MGGTMTTRPCRLLFVITLAASVLGSGRAQGKVIDDGPHHRNELSTIRDALKRSGTHPLHILYVHGIGATGAGDSHMFLTGICPLLQGCKAPKKKDDWHPVKTEYADRGDFAGDSPLPAFEYLGQRVWTTPDEWRDSAPFVAHYVLQRSDGGPVVVDEINWWPLVFPLKCRQIMANEARLAGPDKDFLRLCSGQQELDPDSPGRTYAWITPKDAHDLESIRPKGARINRGLKNFPLDWGFSDAIMAVGSMHDLFREAMRQMFVESVRFMTDGSDSEDWKRRLKNSESDREFIVVSHSLGSYLVFSTLNMDQPTSALQDLAQPERSAATMEEDDAARYILERTTLLYFFANQVPLLELANLAIPQAAGSLSKRMMKWKELRQSFLRNHPSDQAAAKPQVVAWSDPSDLLTWRVPQIGDLVIDNLYVRNTWWHWLFAWPTAVHDGYAQNRDVLRAMLPKAQ